LGTTCNAARLVGNWIRRSKHLASLFMAFFLPGGAWLSFLCGLVGGIIALIAIIRQNERSWLVFLSILPMVNMFVFILAEFLIPH
jgi:hypothetical protein